jgi:hypothetical protein
MLGSDDLIGERFCKEHDGLTRTRPDPLAGVWEDELLALVQTSPHFNGVTLTPPQPVNVASPRTPKPCIHELVAMRDRNSVPFATSEAWVRCRNKHTLPITLTLRKGPQCVTF